MIYVTHDQVEAMTMGDRIVIMDGGRSCRSPRRSRSTTPRQPLRRRVHRHAADELLRRRARGEGAGLAVVLGGRLTLPVPRPAPDRGERPKVTFGIRPEHIQLGGEGNGARVKVPATIEWSSRWATRPSSPRAVPAGLLQIETESRAS